MSVINLLVEGDLDEALGHRLLLQQGADLGVSFGKQGFGYIQQKVQGFARSSAGMPLLTLVDLMDTPFRCPPELIGDWLPYSPSTMLLRVVVQEIESWLLADRANLANHLAVSVSRVPAYPDEVEDPKAQLIRLARHSRSSTVRGGIPPVLDGASTGPLYNSIMVRFVRDHWDPAAAELTSPSLQRATRALASLIARL